MRTKYFFFHSMAGFETDLTHCARASTDYGFALLRYGWGTLSTKKANVYGYHFFASAVFFCAWRERPPSTKIVYQSRPLHSLIRAFTSPKWAIRCELSRTEYLNSIKSHWKQTTVTELTGWVLDCRPISKRCSQLSMQILFLPGFGDKWSSKDL